MQRSCRFAVRSFADERSCEPCWGAPRSAARARVRARNCSSARTSSSSNAPASHRFKRLASSTRVLAPLGTGPRSSLERARSSAHAASSPAAMRSRSPATRQACRTRWSTGMCTTVAAGRRSTRSMKSARSSRSRVGSESCGPATGRPGLAVGRRSPLRGGRGGRVAWQRGHLRQARARRAPQSSHTPRSNPWRTWHACSERMWPLWLRVKCAVKHRGGPCELNPVQSGHRRGGGCWAILGVAFGLSGPTAAVPGGAIAWGCEVGDGTSDGVSDGGGSG